MWAGTGLATFKWRRRISGWISSNEAPESATCARDVVCGYTVVGTRLSMVVGRVRHRLIDARSRHADTCSTSPTALAVHIATHDAALAAPIVRLPRKLRHIPNDGMPP